MKYRIKATHTFYAPTPDLERVLDDGFEPLEFDTEADALTEIERLDERVYYLGHNECARPTYEIFAANAA
ncbi:hypothetical protein [Roseovarius indicus]|uniref:hypothetical protein n=1 Tax=Roseovarius indicus TaxID=540747 RepID=UPI0040593533